MSKEWLKPISDLEEEEFIQNIAQQINEKGYSAPATAFLEMHKPLCYPLTHFAMAFTPFAVPFIGFDTYNKFLHLIGNRNNIEKLLDSLNQTQKT